MLLQYGLFAGGASILNSAFALVDFYNLMAYDYSNFNHSTYTYATQSVNYWRGRGLPASKTAPVPTIAPVACNPPVLVGSRNA